MDCDKTGSSRGLCCCNCWYQCRVEGHPWNAEPFKKHKPKEYLGWGCAMPYTQHRIFNVEGVEGKDEIGTITLWDRQHGMCEEYAPRKMHSYINSCTVNYLAKG